MSLINLIAALEKRVFPARARRWRAWQRHSAGSTAQVDHSAWDALLARHARQGDDDRVGVAYAAFDAHDRAALADYLAALQATPVSALDRDEQLALWCNLYNALTVHAILAHYPVRSFRDTSRLPVWLGGGPWTAKRVVVEGWRLSLNDIEHRILRRNWRDRRVHYALNCGAVDCPDLATRAYTGASVQQTLDAAETRYVNDPRGVRFDGDRLSVSSIYVWFEADFVSPGEHILDYLRRHARGELAARLAGRTRIDGHHYDWRLNEAK